MSHKHAARQFGAHASAYATSATHANGESLARLVAVCRPRREDRVLDIATGAGHTAIAMAPKVREVVAVDVAPQMLNVARDLARERGLANIRFERSAAENLPFGSASFDLVTCRIAAHHFSSVAAFVSEAYRVLKPGGRLGLVDNIVPHEGSVGGYVDALETVRDPSHVRYLSLEAWQSELGGAGFQIQHAETLRKRIDFRDWADRMGVDATTREQLRRIVVEAPADARAYLSPIEESGKLAFHLTEGLLVGRKPTAVGGQGAIGTGESTSERDVGPRREPGRADVAVTAPTALARVGSQEPAGVGRDESAAVIQAVGLTKYYGKRRGVLDLDLTVWSGEVFGFLGPNGSGKTTTIRLLMDLLRPSKGAAQVLGANPRQAGAALRRSVGYLPGELALHERMTGRAFLQYLAHLRGDVSWDHVLRLAERLDVDLGRKIGNLSRGNKQKIGIVQAFMGRPRLLILDEPTTGLDPLVQLEFYTLVAEANAGGSTVFLSSHVLTEVERVADRVGVLREGRIVAVRDLRSIKAEATRHLELHFRFAPPRGLFDGIPGVRSAHLTGSHGVVEIQGETAAALSAAAPYGVVSIATRPLDIESLFLRYYRDDGPGQGAA